MADSHSTLCTVRAVPVAEIDAWAKNAKAGDRFVYFTGPALTQGPAARRARDLYHAGLVDFDQVRRTDCAGFDYVIRWRGRSAARPLACEADEQDDALDVILRELKRAANFAHPCPSDAELAQKAGLATRAQAAWRMKKLREAGVIRTHVTGDPVIARVVTIVKTGKRTAVPETWAAAQRSFVGEAR